MKRGQGWGTSDPYHIPDSQVTQFGKMKRGKETVELVYPYRMPESQATWLY